MWNVSEIRQRFPALKQSPAVFFDGPAGSQVPAEVIAAMTDYLAHSNANHGGAFFTSRESDRLLDEAHAAVADLVGTADPECVSFGANMTSLTFALSRALARTWKPGDEVIVTRLDHDANVTPWVLAARDAGATVRQVGFHPEDGTLDLEELSRYLSARTKLVAVGCASNALGTVNPVGRIIAEAHAAGALVFLDAVHHAPHLPIDVTAWDCDFLACSAYKFFGPHIGILYGKRQHLESLQPYKLRPAPNDLPGRWMTGTQSHEAIVGARWAVEYLAGLGRSIEPAAASRREALQAAYRAIAEYETPLGERLLRGLAALPSVRVFGITDLHRLAERVTTVSFIHRRMSPLDVCEHLDLRGIYAWHGNYYALSVTEALGLEPDGMVRVGILHYNTAEEVDRLLKALAELD
jgi:cysteine desulfurase family protein (TIGR01976 family)